MNFIKKFDILEPPTPEEMVESIPKRWPDAFMKVKMSEQESTFVFSDDIKHISN